MGPRLGITKTVQVGDDTGRKQDPDQGPLLMSEYGSSLQVSFFLNMKDSKRNSYCIKEGLRESFAENHKVNKLIPVKR